MNRVWYQIKHKFFSNKALLAFLCVFFILYIPLIFAEYKVISIQKMEGSSHVLPVLGSDSIQYYSLAENIKLADCFALETCAKPELFRTPGYPFIVYVFNYIFGALMSVVVFQSILAVITGWLVYKISSLYIGDRYAIYTGLLFAIEPSVVFHSLVILSDTTYVFLITLVSYIFLAKARNFRNLTLIAFLVGISAYIRPISIYLFALFAVFYIFESYGDKWRYVHVGGGVFVILAVMLPWVYRNHLVAGYNSFSTVTSYNIFYYNVPMYLAFKNGGSEISEREKLIAQAGLQSNSLFDVSSQERMIKISDEIISSNLISYAKFHILKTASFFFGSSIKNLLLSKNMLFQSDQDEPFSSIDIYSYIKNKDWKNLSKNISSDILVFFERIIWGLIFIAMLLPVIFRREKADMLFMLAIIGYFSVLTGPVSYVRYRLPAEPFMIILAMVSFYFLIRKFNSYLISQKVSLPR